MAPMQRNRLMAVWCVRKQISQKLKYLRARSHPSRTHSYFTCLLLTSCECMTDQVLHAPFMQNKGCCRHPAVIIWGGRPRDNAECGWYCAMRTQSCTFPKTLTLHSIWRRAHSAAGRSCRPVLQLWIPRFQLLIVSTSHFQQYSTACEVP